VTLRIYLVTFLDCSAYLVWPSLSVCSTMRLWPRYVFEYNTDLSFHLQYLLCVLTFLHSTDKPSKSEKVHMAESVISAFPALKAAGNMGYVSLPDIYM